MEPIGNLGKQLHASAVECDGRAVVILGASGSGKSALALNLMARGARLVGDDQVFLSMSGDRPHVSPHPNAYSRIECRGLGVFTAAQARSSQNAEVVLVIDLDHPPQSRLPIRNKYEVEAMTIPLFYAKTLNNLDTFIYLYLTKQLEEYTYE